MKKVFLAAFVLFFSNLSLRSQNIPNSGKPIVEIFTDFHYSLQENLKTTGFSVNRAYIGYSYNADEKFSATIKINLGNPDDVLPESEPRRYSYFREASISYSKNKLNLSLGMITTRVYDYQQKFWGKRFVANTFQSLNGYGFLADLGIVGNYKFSSIIDADISLTNGEGYYIPQQDNNLKVALGITITPLSSLTIRFYGDAIKTQGLWQTTLVGFAGFKNERITIGADISYKSNLDLTKGHDAWGISGTGSVCLTKKIEFFTRYDFSTSVILPGDAAEWNLAKDGKLLINGFQYTFNKIVKVALDNQACFPTDKSKSITDLIYINALFKF